MKSPASHSASDNGHIESPTTSLNGSRTPRSFPSSPGVRSHVPSTPLRGAAAAAGTGGRITAPLAEATAVPPSRVEKVDVAIIGAGLCGLACAVALHKVYPDCNVKVYERRPEPPELTEDASAVGGGVRLEANGLKALTAISRRLASQVMSHGLYAQRVLLHDTEAGTLITHLHEHPHLFHPSPRQPALVVGWAELQQLLLDQLPPNTVQWETAVTSYTDNPSTAGVTLHTLEKVQQDGGEQDDNSSQHDTAPPAVSPFHAVAQDRPATAGSGASVSRQQQQQQQMLEEAEIEHVVVEAQLLIAADGPLSLTRQQLVGDGPPNFDGTLRWVGRLPGDLLSTIPVEYEAWWLGQGMAFNSHPISDGDVAWEAQVNSSSLAAAGLQWDAETHSLVPLRSSSQESSVTERQSQQQQISDHNAAGATVSSSTVSSVMPGQHHGVAGGGADGSFNAVSVAGVASLTDAAVAAAPAGEMELDQANKLELAAAKAEKTAVDISADSAAGDDATTLGQSQQLPSQAVLLQHMFSNFPAPVLDMLAATPPAAFLEAAVMTRPARNTPTSLGRGAVAVVGEAAHPLRPTGQEISQAFEDAAELGACVMTFGLTREALRRLELRRRPRWKHIMQVSQALGTCSNLGGISLHQGLLDYTAQLYQISFVPLRTIQPNKEPQRRRLLRWLGYGLLAYGAAAGVYTVVQRDASKRSAKKNPEGPLEAVVAGVENVASTVKEGAEKLMEGASTNVPNGLLNVVNVGAKGANQAEGALETAVATVAEVAEEAAGKGSGVVHGQLPQNGHTAGAATRFKNAVVGRALSVGTWLGKPFGAFMKHRVVHEVGQTLGAF